MSTAVEATPDILTEKERRRFAELELTIIGNVSKIAEILGTIRDERLYRGEFKTFADYCEKRWRRNVRTINFKIEAHEQRSEIGKNFSQNEPAKDLLAGVSDSAVRELGKVEPEKRAEVLEVASRNGNGPPTAAAIREERQGPPKPKPAPAHKPKPKERASGNGNGTGKSKSKPAPKPPDRNPAAILSSYDAWERQQKARWQKEFGARGWRAHNDKVHGILRDVRAFWEKRMGATG